MFGGMRRGVILLSLLAACERTETGYTVADTVTLHPEVVPAETTEQADTVHVTLREWSVAPAQSTLSAGNVVFHVMNEGKYEHALEVEGAGEEKETERIKPGENASLDIDLKPGTYELYCPVDDSHGKHEGRGMRTTIVVK